MVEAKYNNKLIYPDPGGDFNGPAQTTQGELTFDFTKLGNGSNYVRVTGELMRNSDGTRNFRDFYYGRRSELTFIIQGGNRFTLKLHDNPFARPKPKTDTELRAKIKAKKDARLGPYPFPSR